MILQILKFPPPLPCFMVLKYSDKACGGHNVNSDTGDEKLSCTGVMESTNDMIKCSDILFIIKTIEMAEVANMHEKKYINNK